MMIQDKNLKSLEIMGYEIALLVENDNTCYYSCEISDDISEVYIKAEVASSDLSCEGDLGNCFIHKGVNTFSINVIKDGIIQREYKISIVVKKTASDVGLSVVEIDNDPAEPIIKDGEISYYYYSVADTNGQIEIEAYPSSPNATIAGDIGVQEVVEGVNGFVIIVKSLDGKAKKNYQLLVDCKRVSAPANFDEPLKTDFGQDWSEKNWTEKVEESETEPELEPEPKIELRVVPAPIEEKPIEPQPIEPQPIEPKPKKQKPVKLRALNVMGVTRKSELNEVALSEAIAARAITKDYFRNKLTDDTMMVSASLMPSFSPEIKKYKSIVGYEVNALFIVARSEEKDYEITGDIGYVSLVIGSNQLSIVVHGEATSEEYELCVERQEAMDLQEIYELEQKIGEVLEQDRVHCALSDLLIKDARLDPPFMPEITEYKVITNPGVDKLQIHAVAANEAFSIEGDVGEQELNTGENIFLIKVSTENRHLVYKIRCEKKEAIIEMEKQKKTKTPKTKKKKTKLNSLNTRFKIFSKKIQKGGLTEKKVVRTTRLLHKLIGTTLFMASVSYLLYTYLLEPSQLVYKGRQTTQSEISAKRRTVEEHLKNRENMRETISLAEGEIWWFREKYPVLPSQEEILLYLSELKSKITFDYNIITVGMEEPLYSNMIAAEIMDKNIGRILPDMATVIPPGVQPDTNAAPTPVSGEGEENNIKHDFNKNTVFIAIKGTYENLLKVYEELSNNSRMIIGDNIQFASQRGTVETEELEWELSMDLFYYYYTGLEEIK